MDKLKGEHYLLSKRDGQESNRLNLQHNLISKIRNGHVLDPSIPKDGVLNICDVATGTGIWLDDVAAELSNSGITNLEVTGFDISSAQFPTSTKPGFNFVVWDMNEAFPKEYHGQFDVVHVRLVVLVVTSDKFKNTVDNLVALLKPGGFLQWDDFDWRNELGRMYPTAVQQTGSMCLEFFKTQNWSTNLFFEVTKALESTPLRDLHMTDYTPVAHDQPELQEGFYEWHKQLHRGVLPPLMMRAGHASNMKEALKLVDDYEILVDKAARDGAIFPMPLVTLIGRKNV